MAILSRSEEGCDAIAALGEAYIARLAESPTGSLQAWREMQHMDRLDTLHNLADLHQRVCGAIEQAKEWM